MALSVEETAQRLLDAHVQWIIERLDGPGFEQEAQRLVDEFLRDAAELKLGEVVTPQAIHDTVRKYAVEMQLGGAIPALVGDLARRIYDHRIHRSTQLQDLIPDRVFEEFLDKFLELKPLRKELVRLSVSNPIFGRLVADILYSGIRDYIKKTGQMTDRLPGAKSARKLGKALVSKASPSLSDSLDDNLRLFLQKYTKVSLKSSERFLLSTFESEEFRSVVLDYWHQNKSRPVASVREYAGSIDFEELFVIAYEYWQELRETEFFSVIVNSGIDGFFEQFSDRRLSDLLSDIGVERDMMVDDAMRFAPPIITLLRARGMLDTIVRRQLQGFYRSAEIDTVLTAALGD